jgi:hypothetical protein
VRRRGWRLRVGGEQTYAVVPDTGVRVNNLRKATHNFNAVRDCLMFLEAIMAKKTQVQVKKYQLGHKSR